MILNKKGVFNRCAVPKLAVKFKSKMWEEKRKFKPIPDLAETNHCLEDMVAAREEGRKTKQDIMKGKKRKKEVWCGNHGEVAWGVAGSADNGKRRRKFLYEHPEEGSLEPGQVRVVKRLKQKLIVPLTENEVMARLLVELATMWRRRRSGPWSWRTLMHVRTY